MNMNLEPNQIIDNRYKIIEKLGEGGMGAVWKARHVVLGDEVVLKMPLFHNDPEMLKRFGKEAKTMRKHSIECPHILNIEDIGELNGVPWYVMRFLPGGSVRDRVLPHDEMGGANWDEDSFDWLVKIASALDYLHGKEAYHRDVKPENILFSQDGTPYLVDFGIVKTVNETTSMMTEQGKAVGTMAYMAPEILDGGKFTAQSDQYSLAVTLYETLTGERPFSGTTFFSLFRSIQQGHRKLAELHPVIPLAASVTVDRALSHDPAVRFESCEAFAQSFLQGLLTEEEHRNKPSEMVTGARIGFSGEASSGGKLFPHPTDKPANGAVHPHAASKSRLFVLGAVMAALFIAGTIFTVGNFDSDESKNRTPVSLKSKAVQQEIERRSQEIANQKLREEAEQEKARVIAEQEEARRIAKEEEAKRVKAKELEAARLAAEKEDAEKEDARKREEAKRAKAKELEVARLAAEKEKEDARKREEARKRELARQEEMRRKEEARKREEEARVTELTAKAYRKASVAQLEKHAELGFAGAQTELGNRANKKKNYGTALDWYRKAAKKNDARAQHKLGLAYAAGNGVSKDDFEAFSWIRKAAVQGNADGEYALGNMYMSGRGTAKNNKEAVYWYRKAAEQGKSSAYTNLGWMYQKGLGVPKSYDEALRWYRKAAETGCEFGQNNLGGMYSRGFGVAKDHRQAVYWYRKSAEQGWAVAQNNLGKRYRDGEGVERNLSEAMKWFSKAAAQGHEEARTNLSKLQGN